MNSLEEINKTSLVITGMIKHFELLQTMYVHQIFFDYSCYESTASLARLVLSNCYELSWPSVVIKRCLINVIVKMKGSQNYCLH